jgi:Spy/CpxP family protein refolding chaperone
MSKTLATAFLLTFLGSGATVVSGAQPSPYTGQEKREIKALSSEEVATYLEGKGTGMAKAAELNHYPGPAHVLALATELGLTPDQRARTDMLFKAMETEAVTLGKQLIERERELDELFASKTITKEKLQRALEAIALMQGKVRQVHLQTHLIQAEILDAEQIRKYDELRGYAQATSSTHHGHPQQH